MSDDRRSEKRLEVCLDAVWDGKSGNYSARVTDLSEGGCYVDSLSQAHDGELLNIGLELPNGEWLNLTGEVAHQTPSLGFGIRFVNLEPEKLEKLRALLTDLQQPHAPIRVLVSR